MLVLVAFALLPSHAMAQPLADDVRGYVPRGCGFDMNDNGIVGEPADCNVCDGVTTDPDGDGDPEDLIYVDCNSGNDSTGAGTPGNPYRTVGKALAVADGPGDGREDIICARATCGPANGSALSNQDIRVSGVGNKGPTGSWFYVRPRRGPEERDFQYPADPVMIVGWDTDNDGQYPPFDNDQPEPLVFDACSTADCSGGAAAVGFRLGSDSDYIEFAHFTMKNYGRSGGSPASSISLSGSGNKVGVFLHDIAIEKPNYRAPQSSQSVAIYMMMGGASLTWSAIENIRIADYGSWSMRGNLNGRYFRLRNVDLFGPKPIAGQSSAGLKLWSQKDSEYLSINFDADWANRGTTGAIEAFHISLNSENVVLRNNSFRNCDSCVRVEYRICPYYGTPGRCNEPIGSTTSRNILIDRQLFIRDAIPPPSGGGFIKVMAASADGNERGGANILMDPNCVEPTGLTNLTITNSAFVETKGTGNAIVLKIGSNCAGAPLGPVAINNNTFAVNPAAGSREPLINIGQAPWYDYDYLYYAQSYDIRNNVFAGVESDEVVRLKHIGGDKYYGNTKYPGKFVATDNSYGRNPKFGRDTTVYSSLSAWQSGTGYDGGSSDCDTVFAGDGYHLAATDTCSKNRAQNSFCPAADIDGRARAKNTSDQCDRGADEEGNGGAPPPDTTPSLSAPVLREVVPSSTR